LVRFLVEAARDLPLCSAHDLSDGGLAVGLAEAAIGGPYAEGALGAKVDLREVQANLATDALLFGEDHGRALLSIAADQAGALLSLARRAGVAARVIGTVGEKLGRLEMVTRDATLRLGTVELRETFYNAIPRRMEPAASQDAAD
jgi:phosphoribosylformylglycinamidine (FGAM) synthase-like enzyme